MGPPGGSPLQENYSTGENDQATLKTYFTKSQADVLLAFRTIL
jgi:hypothetical protein